ncbi:hypothetical protein WBJ53_15070 [Spirosoma sp. SC4-14]|uniref:hypothetical protein n=1 Tax=Spirosoma sp. SC4-14 TaxID=3128900 RepID=UPI0030CA5FC4
MSQKQFDKLRLQKRYYDSLVNSRLFSVNFMEVAVKKLIPTNPPDGLLVNQKHYLAHLHQQCHTFVAEYNRIALLLEPSE